MQQRRASCAKVPVTVACIRAMIRIAWSGACLENQAWFETRRDDGEGNLYLAVRPPMAKLWGLG
jgi:glutamine synthetase